MSKENEKDLAKTQELFELLQGRIPEGYTMVHPPRLTADEAWSVIWFLGNQYWQVTDRVERCGVCGSLYHTWQEGHCLDFGHTPYNFCEDCMNSRAFLDKYSSPMNLEREPE